MPKSPQLMFNDPANEQGSMTVFAMGLIVGIFGVSGLALDTMHYEAKRVATQDALDRCALMSAIAQNRIDGGATTGETATSIATDCMAKSSVGAAGLGTPSITTQNSERSVTLSGNYTFDAMFPGEGDPTSKTFALTSTSKQKLPNLEITVAVDITHASFWTMFKAPLITFLNTIAAPDTGQKVTVNLIPFTKGVFLGGTTLAQLGAKNEPPFTTKSVRTCLTFPPDADNEIPVDMEDKEYSWSWPVYLRDISNGDNYALNTYPLFATETLATAYGKPYIETVSSQPGVDGQVTNLNSATLAQSNCSFWYNANNTALFGAQIARPVSTAAGSTINDKIASIAPASYNVANRANSLEGMRWALAAMDPSLRDLFTAKVGAGQSPAPVAGRPRNYNAEDTLKVLIFVPNNVMRVYSPGAITGTLQTDMEAQFVREIRPEYLDGTEPAPLIFRTPDAELTTRSIRYSIFHPDAPDPAKPYWVTRDRFEISPETAKAHWAAAPFQYPSGGAPVRQTWKDIFSKMTLGYLIRELYVLPMSKAGVLPSDSDYRFDTLVNKFSYVVDAQADLIPDFLELCDDAKDDNVLIYTLLGNGAVTQGGTTASVVEHNSFAVPAMAAYQACATSPAHTFLTGSLGNVRSALRLIASNIAQLTLTQ